MKKEKPNSPGRIFSICFLIAFISALAVIGIMVSRGYTATVGRLYITDGRTYLVNEENIAFIVVDGSKKGNLFTEYSNGDEVIVVHGPIRESYPMTTNAVFAIRLKKGDGNYKPDENVVGLEPGFENPTGDIAFEVHYIRTDGYHEEISYPLVIIIRSPDELKSYYEANKDKYDLDHGRSDGLSFSAVCEKYNDVYFEDQILIIVLLEEGSGSNHHAVKKVAGTADGKLVIEIERIVPEVGTCDMAEWHLLIEPEPNISLADESDVIVNISTKNQ